MRMVWDAYGKGIPLLAIPGEIPNYAVVYCPHSWGLYFKCPGLELNSGLGNVRVRRGATWQNNHSIQDIQNLPKHPLRISQTSVQAAVARASQTIHQRSKIATSLRLWGNLIVQYPPSFTAWFHINIAHMQWHAENKLAVDRWCNVPFDPPLSRPLFNQEVRSALQHTAFLLSSQWHHHQASWSIQHPGAFSKLCRMQDCTIDWQGPFCTSHLTKGANCDLQGVSGWPLYRQPMLSGSTTPPPRVSSDTSLQPSLHTPALNTKVTNCPP